MMAVRQSPLRDKPVVSLRDLARRSDWPDISISGLSLDSRLVEPGDLFVAVPGEQFDGRRYIADAVQRGAVAVLTVVDDGFLGAGNANNVPVIKVANPRLELARLAGRFYQPMPKKIVAATGTNGKSSVVDFVRQIWAFQGKTAASVGTLGARVQSNGELTEGAGGGLTTPDVIGLHQMLSELARDGVDHVAIEASSHGLAQYRLDGVPLSAAGFTNLTRDHIDYHGSLDAYFMAKLRLFGEVLAPGATAVIHADTRFGEEVDDLCWARGLKAMTTGVAGRDLEVIRADAVADGIEVEIAAGAARYQIAFPLIGGFQLENALLAAGLVIATSGDPETTLSALEVLKPVPGRLERVGETPAGAQVIVDYSHTPDALRAALQALRPHTKNKLHVVFGCGGDRDTGKRPLMGEAAAHHADHVIITDDNPRGEDPAQIRSAAMAGAPNAREIADRADAIETAIRKAQAGDTVLVAGKGHETGQHIGGEILPFSDVEIVAAFLKPTGVVA
ncbi:MAG: UDP-N-acetylmuramoyl-L-alanyl-D-glutamate--2,6-diaminopimelate ligase [Pseudomonadota bacterium]